MGNKYELTEETMEYDGHTLHRIKALKSFRTLKNDYWGYTINKGDLGGWVESEKNLSQEGNCWIRDNSKVYGEAKITDDRVINESEIHNGVTAGGRGVINRSKISGCILIYSGSNVVIISDSEIYGDNIVIGDNSDVKESYISGDNICISGNSSIHSNSKISGEITIHDSYIEKSHISGAVLVNNSTISNSIIKTKYHSDIEYRNDIEYGIIIFSSTIRYSNIYRNKITKFDSTIIIDTKYDDFADIKNDLMYQCQLFVEQDDSVIAYKVIDKYARSFRDSDFEYVLIPGFIIEVEDFEPSSSISCGKGLHFSCMKEAFKYVDNIGYNSSFIIVKAKISLDDIITVANGKIRCKKATILDSFRIGG